MNKQEKVKYSTCIFAIQKIGSDIVRFETKVLSLEDKKIKRAFSFMKRRIWFCNGEIYSCVLSENNLKIINLLLEDLETKPKFLEETKIFKVLQNEFNSQIMY